MGTDIKAKVTWFNADTETIESESVSAWRIEKEEGDEFATDDGICVALGGDDDGKDVVLTDEVLASLGYVRG